MGMAIEIQVGDYVYRIDDDPATARVYQLVKIEKFDIRGDPLDPEHYRAEAYMVMEWRCNPPPYRWGESSIGCQLNRLALMPEMALLARAAEGEFLLEKPAYYGDRWLNEHWYEK